MKPLQWLGVLCLGLSATLSAFAQQNLSEQMAATALKKWKDSLVVGSSVDGKARWVYQQSLLLKAVYELYKKTGDQKYFDYIKKSVDFFVRPDGSIRTYKADEHSIDNIPMGRILLILFNTTHG